LGNLLDRTGKVVAILAAIVGIASGLTALYNRYERPRVQLQIHKDRNRIPPHLLALVREKITQDPESLKIYQSSLFGSVTVDVYNNTDREVADAILEIGGLTQFGGAEAIDSQLQGKDLAAYQATLSEASLQPGLPCPKSRWGVQPDKKLDLRIPPLKSYGGHITLAVYGEGYENADVCLNGADATKRYLIKVPDSRMLQLYPVFLMTLSGLLVVTALLLFMLSDGIRKSRLAGGAG
jgi:hypothetical protein